MPIGTLCQKAEVFFLKCTILLQYKTLLVTTWRGLRNMSKKINIASYEKHCLCLIYFYVHSIVIVYHKRCTCTLRPSKNS